MAEHLAEFRRYNIGETLRAKATLEATLEALPDAVVLLDHEGRALSINRQAREVMALHASTDTATASVAGRSLAELASRSNAEEVTDLTSALRVEVRGSPRRFVSRALPVHGIAGERPGTILVLYDVTDLARLDEMRAELIAVASHELRTPLTTLRMTLLMLDEAAGTLPARERELVATCNVGVQQLSDTIDEFLDLTRMEAGQLRLTVEPLSIASVLLMTKKRWQGTAGEREVTIEIDAPSELLVSGDRARLRAVFDNLLSNALKYAPAGSEVSLVARSAGGRVEISVTDEGPGIPTEYRELVFDKFFRVEHEVGSDQGVRGVGIGLYLCRQIVALHGGTVRCAAGTSGKGARLVVDVPALRDTAPEP